MARPRILKNKPLVEAILEVRWNLEEGPVPGTTSYDPHYKFLLGKLFDSVRSEFPHHEELPAASAPEEITGNIVHHRFRTAANSWPALQVGPGVFTVNETTGYVWERFEALVNKAVPTLIASHPSRESLKFNTVMLRYLNAVPLDPVKVDVLQFLKEKLKSNVALPSSIFDEGVLDRKPVRLSTEMMLRCSKPKGALMVKFNTGTSEKKRALVFELGFVSRNVDVPEMPQGFGDWVRNAHKIVEDTFFALIEGDLEREFAGDA